MFEILEDQGAGDFVAWCVVEALIRLSQEIKDDEASDSRGPPEASRNHLKANIGKRARILFEQKESSGEDYSRLRARAVYLLGWLTDRTASGMLTRAALKDKNPFVRGYIVEAMARRDIKDARRTIEDHLSTETHPFVLRRIAEALGQIGTLDSIVELEEHLRSQQAPARWSARVAIEEILERNALSPEG